MKEIKIKVLNPGVDFGNVFDFLNELLIQDGIPEKEIQAFLKPSKKYINDPLLMKNMKEAVEIVHGHVERGSRILVRVDCDVDGYCSSSELIQFLKTIKPELQIDFLLNYQKHHGLTYEDICDVTRDYYGLIIVPDASMTLEDAKTIHRNYTADIVVLDHHLVEYADDGDNYTNYCTAVNCTDGEYPNPCLSGAGVVQKFVECYVDTYGLDSELKEKWIDLVSTAIVADSMSLKNLENRYYVMEGLKEENHNNDLISEIYDRMVSDEEKWKGRLIKTIGWSIAPLINGVIRIGTPDEQQEAFRAICGDKEDIEYQPRRKSKDDPLPPLETHTLQWNVARELVNSKSRQDNAVRKITKELDKVITDQGLDQNSIIFVDATKIIDSGAMTGLVANKIASKYMRPAVIMRAKSSSEYGGSMRGYGNSVIENTKEFLESTGLISIMGHENAGGLSLVKENLPALISKCNEMCDPSELGIIYTCDYEIPASELRQEYVREVGEYAAVFGNDIPEPLFLISDLEINASDIQAYGETCSFIRFIYNNLCFIKKFCKAGEFDQLTGHEMTDIGVNKRRLRLDLVCKFGLTAYDGKTWPEVTIVDFGSKVIDDGQNVVNDGWDFEESISEEDEEEFTW